MQPSRCIPSTIQTTSREQDPLSWRIRLNSRKSRFAPDSHSDPSHTPSLESLGGRGGIVTNFPFLILSKLVLDAHTIFHLWYLHGFLWETMCTTYTPSIIWSSFLLLWFPTGNHMYYILHYTWYPHDHHAYPPCIPLFKRTFRLVVSLASLCFLNNKVLLLALRLEATSWRHDCQQLTSNCLKS